MRAYSLDLRERIIAALQEGQTEKQVAVRFGVSESTVTRYDRLARTQQSLTAKVSSGKPPLLRPEHEADFRAMLAAGTAAGTEWTLETMRHAWQERSGILLSKSALHVHLTRLKVTYKKEQAS
jgi:transposase